MDPYSNPIYRYVSDTCGLSSSSSVSSSSLSLPSSSVSVPSSSVSHESSSSYDTLCCDAEYMDDTQIYEIEGEAGFPSYALCMNNADSIPPTITSFCRPQTEGCDTTIEDGCEYYTFLGCRYYSGDGRFYPWYSGMVDRCRPSSSSSSVSVSSSSLSSLSVRSSISARCCAQSNINFVQEDDEELCDTLCLNSYYPTWTVGCNWNSVVGCTADEGCTYAYSHCVLDIVFWNCYGTLVSENCPVSSSSQPSSSLQPSSSSSAPAPDCPADCDLCAADYYCDDFDGIKVCDSDAFAGTASLTEIFDCFWQEDVVLSDGTIIFGLGSLECLGSEWVCDTWLEAGVFGGGTYVRPADGDGDCPDGLYSLDNSWCNTPGVAWPTEVTLYS